MTRSLLALAAVLLTVSIASGAEDDHCRAQRGVIEAVATARATWCLALRSFGGSPQACLDQATADVLGVARSIYPQCQVSSGIFADALAAADQVYLQQGIENCGVFGTLCGGSCPDGLACSDRDGACGCVGGGEECPRWDNPRALCATGERCLRGRCLPANTRFPTLCGSCPAGQIGVGGASIGKVDQECVCIDPWSEQACGYDDQAPAASIGFPRRGAPVIEAVPVPRGYCPPHQTCTDPLLHGAACS